VGEAVRIARAEFDSTDPAAAPSATFMAYQYFGHPSLQLDRPTGQGAFS